MTVKVERGSDGRWVACVEQYPELRATGATEQEAISALEGEVLLEMRRMERRMGGQASRRLRKEAARRLAAEGREMPPLPPIAAKAEHLVPESFEQMFDELLAAGYVEEVGVNADGEVEYRLTEKVEELARSGTIDDEFFEAVRRIARSN